MKKKLMYSILLIFIISMTTPIKVLGNEDSSYNYFKDDEGDLFKITIPAKLDILAEELLRYSGSIDEVEAFAEHEGPGAALIYGLLKSIFILYKGETLSSDVIEDTIEALMDLTLQTPEYENDYSDISHIQRLASESQDEIIQVVKYKDLEELDEKKNTTLKVTHLGTRSQNNISIGTFIKNRFTPSLMIFWFLMFILTGGTAGEDSILEAFIRGEISGNSTMPSISSNKSKPKSSQSAKGLASIDYIPKLYFDNMELILQFLLIAFTGITEWEEENPDVTIDSDVRGFQQVLEYIMNKEYDLYFERQSTNNTFPFFFIMQSMRVEMNPTNLKENALIAMFYFILEAFLMLTPLSLILTVPLTTEGFIGIDESGDKIIDMRNATTSIENDEVKFNSTKTNMDRETFVSDITIVINNHPETVQTENGSIDFIKIENFEVYIDMCPEWTDPINPYWIGFGYEYRSEISHRILWIAGIILFSSILSTLIINLVLLYKKKTGESLW